MDVTFGRRLEDIREAKALTLPELSKRSQLGLATLCRYQKMASPGRIAYEALVRLANALEVDVGYLTGEDQVLVRLEPFQVAARESLKRFLELKALPRRLRAGLTRIQDDPAAPRSTQQWEDFWRLLRQATGRSRPKQRVETTSQRSEQKSALRLLTAKPGKASEQSISPLRLACR